MNTVPLVQDLLASGGEMVETHISWVVLQGENVWKLKKPVSLGFLDFTTPEKRRAACEAEVRLNRRLAPQVYHGCVAVTRDRDGGHHFGGPGDVVDWAVHMARLPDGNRADIHLGEGRLDASHLERIAERLATFHAAARCDDETTRYGSVEVIATNVQENFEQTHGTIHAFIDPRQAEEIETWQRDYLRQQGESFEARCRAGRVRDGHGDLRLEHIYLDAGEDVVIIDCIEFNRRFRFADVCADVAFLAMDLAWHGRPDLAERFLAFYARAANDYDLYQLVDFYESYRAFVRGKIASLVAADPDADTASRQRFARDAHRYYLLALASERRALLPPQVVAVGGMIAAGKSTVAAGLAAKLAAPVVDADRTRKWLLGVSPTRPVHEPAWHGAYAPESTDKVYAEVLRRADVVLSSGRTVILDASFRSSRMRSAARSLAERHGVPFHFVECRTEPEVCRRRLHRREQERGVSDGRLEIFDDFMARWQPVDELPTDEHTLLDTSQPLAANLEVLRGRLGGWPD